MDWRTWAFDRLTSSDPVTDLVPVEWIFGGGSLTEVPARRPFVILRFGVEQSDMWDGDGPAATSQYLTVYIHDEPGDYLRINEITLAIRAALQGPVADGVGGISALWQGDSQDLADDVYGTIMRNAEFRLLGKVS